MALAEDSFLSDDFLSQITAAGEVDILVGVPTLNNAKTVEHVISAIQVGLVKYFPRERTALVDPDGGSRDGTLEVVKSASVRDFRTLLASNPLRTMHTLTCSYPATWGRGGALHIILAAADLLRAKACAIVSPDVESITPEWIEGLIRPIYREKFDFVAPVYQRQKFDGLMIKNILAPVTAAVYGYEIEEPLGGELGFSGPLACHYLELDVWRQDFMRFAPEIWMIATAMLGDYKLCQSFLGARIHSSKSLSSDLPGTIQQVVGALFSCMEVHQSSWMSRQGVTPAPVVGFEYHVPLRPVRFNRKRMFRMFQTGVEQLASILESILSTETLQSIREIAKLSDEKFRFPDALWVKTIYEFAGSFHRSVINQDHLMQVLTPLYRGRISSFLQENQEADAEEIRERLKALRVQFLDLRAYLNECWSVKA